MDKKLILCIELFLHRFADFFTRQMKLFLLVFYFFASVAILWFILVVFNIIPFDHGKCRFEDLADIKTMISVDLRILTDSMTMVNVDLRIIADIMTMMCRSEDIS